MKPINNWELINEAGEFKRLPAGIYLVRITNVIDVPEKEYLEIYCDIVKGEYTNYFKSLVESGLRDTSKHIRSYKTNAIPFFKAFMTAVEKTNPGYKWDWDEKKLIGKLVVAVFGEEEYLDNEGKVKTATSVVEFRSLEAYKEGKVTVPPLKKLPEAQKPVIENESPIPELSDLDMPFL